MIDHRTSRPRRRALVVAPLILGGLAVFAPPSFGVLGEQSPSSPLAAGTLINVESTLVLEAGDSLRVGADLTVGAGDVVEAESKVSLQQGETLLSVDADLSLDAGELLAVGDGLLPGGTLPDLLPTLPITIPTLPGVPVVTVPNLPLPGGGGPPKGGGSPAPAPAPVNGGGGAPSSGTPAVSAATRQVTGSPVTVAPRNVAACSRIVLRTTMSGPARMKASNARTFKVKVRNRSFTPAAGVTVKVTAPRGFKLVTRTAKGRTVLKSTMRMSVGKLAAHRTRTLKVVVRSSRTVRGRAVMKASTSARCVTPTLAKRTVKVTGPGRVRLPAVTG